MRISTGDVEYFEGLVENVSRHSRDVFVGIDPGKNGAIVAVARQSSGTGFDLLAAFVMPLNDDGQIDCKKVAQIVTRNKHKSIIIEKPSAAAFAFRGNVRRTSSTALFSSGESWGRLCATLDCYGFSFSTVAPVTWTAALTRKAPGADSKAKAASVFDRLCSVTSQFRAMPPRHRTLHDGIVDAALIAYYSLIKDRR
jgi:hypothetical protein